MLVCVLLCAFWHARPRVQRAPGLPCALYFSGRNEFAKLGRMLSRECEVTHSRRPGLAPGPIRRVFSFRRCGRRSPSQPTPGVMGPGAEAGTTLVDFSDSSNNDATHTQLRLLATHGARGLQIHSPQKMRGRREDRVRAAPAVSCAKVDKKTHMSIQVQRKHSGLPCAMVLQLIPCSPRRDHSLFVTVAPKKRELLANLTPAIGASGPHDFAVRFSRARQSQLSRPSLPAPTSVTMANAPSLGTGWQGISR